MLAEVETSAARGYALDEEGHTEGIDAVGVALMDPLGRPLALSIPVPTPRFARRKRELLEHLIAARKRIVQAIGAAARGKQPGALWHR